MAWSAENATKALIGTLNMLTVQGNTAMEPNVSQFISALAAGSGARLMVEACRDSAGPTTVALISAAQQTGGRVLCIVPGPNGLQASEAFLGANADQVELVIGNASALLAEEFKAADFVLVDCEMDKKENVYRAAQRAGSGVVVVGYNAFGKVFRKGSGGLKVDMLPIGGGLRVCRVPPRAKRSNWLVRVDECTGEEHVFRVTTPGSSCW